MPARPRLGVRPILFPRPRVHHARVSRPALFTNRALGAVRHHTGRARLYEIRGLDLCRRHRVRDSAAGSLAAGGRRHVQQLLDRLSRRGTADRPLYRTGRNAGGGVHGRRADVHPGGGIGTAHGVRARQAGRLARAAARVGPRSLQSVETAGPRRNAGHVGAGEGRRSHRLVLQRQLPLARHAVLRPDHWSVVLVHRPVHRAARARSEGRAHCAAGQHLRRLSEALACLPFHHSRTDCVGTGEDGSRRGSWRHAGCAGARPGFEGSWSPVCSPR